MVELWALRDGLYLAIQLGINFLEVELDAKVIVEMLNSADCFNRKHSPLFHDCRSLLSRLTQARVVHVFKEVNKCADFLARRGCFMRENLLFLMPHPLLIQLICLCRMLMVGLTLGLQPRHWPLWPICNIALFCSVLYSSLLTKKEKSRTCKDDDFFFLHFILFPLSKCDDRRPHFNTGYKLTCHKLSKSN